MASLATNFDSGTPRPGRPATGAPDRVYEALRERILSFDLPPGTVLSRSEIADEYRVSQTPVRDALLRLGQDGLVRIFPQSKTLVTHIDVQQLSEAHFLRVAVETEVARRLAGTSNPAALGRAKGILRMQEALLGAPDQIDVFADLDRDFHRTLFDGVGVLPLYKMVTDRLGHLYRCQRLELPHEGRARDIVAAHGAILKGIESGDPSAAAAAVREHLSGTISRIDSIREKYPEHFTDGDPL